MAEFKRPSFSIRDFGKAIRNDLKGGYLGKNPSVVGNLILGEPWNANTKWGKPKKYQQESFKMPDGRTWGVPKAKASTPQLEGMKTSKYRLQMQKDTNGGYKLPGLVTSTPSAKKTLGTQITPTPTAAPTMTPAPDRAADPYTSLINETTEKNRLPKHLLYNLLKTESNFNPNALSSAGAQGIAQIVPKWHPGVDPNNPEEAIPYAGQHLRKSKDNFGGWDEAMAAYNAGGPAVGQYGGVPPYPETEAYVEKINNLIQKDIERFKKEKK